MPKPVICIGASFIDELFHAKETLQLDTIAGEGLTNVISASHRFMQLS